MFQAGFALAQTEMVSDLRQVFHISEGWMSAGKPGAMPINPPSQDPNRREVFLVFGLNVAAGVTTITLDWAP